MSKQRCCVHKHTPTTTPTQNPTPIVSVGEPTMRRWPHPVEAVPPVPELTRLLQQQTELLLEIRALLTTSTSRTSDKK